MNWRNEKISSFTEVITGGTPSTNKKEFWDGGTIPWLNSGDLNQGVVTQASNLITEEGYKSSSTKLMPPNTVLIALTGATTGLAALLKIEACANQSVTGIFPSSKHHPEFLYYFFKTQRQRILDTAWGGAQPHINQSYVKDYVVPLPPIPDQIKIATVLSTTEALIKQRKKNKAEVLKLQLKNSLIDLENLFDSLSQKAFKSELDLSGLETDHSISDSKGGSDASKNPQAASTQKNISNADKLLKTEEKEKRNVDPFDVDEETARKLGKTFYGQWKKLHAEKKKTKLIWDKVSAEQISNWVKEAYEGFHFNSEMLIRFLIDEHIASIDYYSSEELKKYPRTNESDDLKSFIFSALGGDNPYLKLEQVFYNAQSDNINLNLREKDCELLKHETPDSRTGIYLRITS